MLIKQCEYSVNFENECYMESINRIGTCIFRTIRGTNLLSQRICLDNNMAENLVGRKTLSKFVIIKIVNGSMPLFSATSTNSFHLKSGSSSVGSLFSLALIQETSSFVQLRRRVWETTALGGSSDRRQLAWLKLEHPLFSGRIRKAAFS